MGLDARKLDAVVSAAGVASRVADAVCSRVDAEDAWRVEMTYTDNQGSKGQKFTAVVYGARDGVEAQAKRLCKEKDRGATGIGVVSIKKRSSGSDGGTRFDAERQPMWQVTLRYRDPNNNSTLGGPARVRETEYTTRASSAKEAESIIRRKAEGDRWIVESVTANRGD